MDQNDSTVEINPTQQFDQIQKDPNISLEIQSNVDVDDPKEVFQCPQKTPNTKQKRFKRDSTSMADEAYHVMKSLYQKNEVKDEFEIFGQHVACKIRKLSTSYAKSTVQYHINNIIYQAELGQYDQPLQTQFNTYQKPSFNYQPSSSLSVSESSSSGPPTSITSFLPQLYNDYETTDEA